MASCRVTSELPLSLSLCLVANLLLHGAARYARRPFRLGRGLLTRRALYLLTFRFIGDLRCVHQFLFNPAYFSTSFFRPKRGKFTVILASSPSPSRRTTVPVPYLGWSTTVPGRAPRRTGGGACGSGLAAIGGRGTIGGRCCGVGDGFPCPCGGRGPLNAMPRSPKNWLMW